MPTFDGGDDFVGIGGPDEGLGIIIGFGDELIDGCLQVGHGFEDTALETVSGELGEISLDGVEPGARGRHEVEDEARMTGEPGAYLGMLVGGIVVEDHMHHLAGWRLALNGIQEAEELLVTVALHTAPGHGAVEHVEGGKQGGGTVAFVVVGHGAGPPLLQGQAGLGAIEGLDLRLLIDREDDGMGGGIDIEPNHAAQLGDELGIVGELELAHLVRLQAVGTPDAVYRADADPDCRGHHRSGPVRGLGRRLGEGQFHHPLGHLGRQRRNTRGSGLVAQQALHALFSKAFLPAPDASLGLAGLAHDRVGAHTRGAEQHDTGSPDVLLRRVPIPHQRFEPQPVTRRLPIFSSGARIWR